jgi:mevalonate kinase
MAIAYAPGKVILFGEHAVVYGRPAIAVPVSEVRARACVEPGDDGQGARVHALDLGRVVVVSEAPDDDPLARIVRLTLLALAAPPDPDLDIFVTSTIPIARGMGSGAAVSTAIVRALQRYFQTEPRDFGWTGRWLSSRGISELVYQTEVLYHGTPSGIDNTVVAYEKPVYFSRDAGWEIFWPARSFCLLVADTGIESPTKAVVGDLRHRFQADPNAYEPLFDRVGGLAREARSAIEEGRLETLGRLMDQNHALLRELGVSSPELDRLVAAARDGGALGAKMSGAGWGGNVIVLVDESTSGQIDMLLRLAGAVHVIITQVR